MPPEVVHIEHTSLTHVPGLLSWGPALLQGPEGFVQALIGAVGSARATVLDPQTVKARNAAKWITESLES